MFKFKDKKPKEPIKQKAKKAAQSSGLTKLTGTFWTTAKIGANEWNKLVEHIEALEYRVGELEKGKLI